MSLSTVGRKKTREPKMRIPRPAVVTDPQVKPLRGREYALQSVVGNVTLTKTEVTVWFTLRARSVSFQPDTQVETMIADGGSALADLAGFRVFIRATYRPVSVREMADRTWQDAVDHTAGPLPSAVPMLVREQERIATSDLNEKFVFFGVRVATQRRYPRDSRREVTELAAVLEKVSGIVAEPGMDARPSSPAEMDLLLRKSFGLGLPLPPRETHVLGDWDQSDLPELASEVLVTAEPWAQSCEVSSHDQVTGETISSRVAILTMGRLGDMEIPQDRQGGWMNRSDRLPFPVEWMATIDVLPDEKVNTEMRKQIDKIVDQNKHYTVEHGKPAPRALARQNALALEVEDQLSKGLGGLATRTNGWYRMAVTGHDDAEIRAKVATIRALYGRQVEWWWSNGQYDLVREFVPGERLANDAERRRLTAPSVMMGLPAATAEIGDGYGVLLGETSGVSVKPVLWAPWRDMEVYNRSGLALLSGGLGSGKSLLAGEIIYQTVQLGSRWTILDPSAQLGRLCEIPDLAPYSRHTNLLDGRNGELNPYAVLKDPRRENFDDRTKSELQNQREFEEEGNRIKALRVSVCQDLLQSLLPRDLRSDSKARSVVRNAVGRVPGEMSSSPMMVLANLSAIAAGQNLDDNGIEWTMEHRIAARDIYDELSLFASTPKGALVFGESPETSSTNDRILLNVYSLAGLSIPTPDDLARGDEKADARASMALFNMAAWLVQQDMYLGDRNERKGILIDEGHLLTEFEQGEALISVSSVDSRKHNARVILASQILRHFHIDKLAPLTSIVFTGNTTDPQAAQDNLELSGLQATPENIHTLETLTPVVHQDPDEPPKEVPHRFLISTKEMGSVERVTIYADVHPDAWDALDTTPNRKKVSR